MIHTLELDFETASNLDLKARGLDNYSRDDSTRVLMCAYALDGGEFVHWQAHQRKIPSDLRDALMDSDVEKHAFNAQFERTITNRTLRIPSPIRGWRCTMVQAYLQCFYGGLDIVGECVGLPLEKQKITTGKRLIKTFCEPQKVTSKQPHAWRDWRTDPALWQEFCDYNIQDCVAERGVRRRLAQHPTPAKEWELYEIDQAINDFGFPVDRDFVKKAIAMRDARKAELTASMREITGLANPGSVQQLLPWLRERGYIFNDMQKASIEKVLAVHKLREDEGKPLDLTPECVSVLKMRQWQARTSLSKFEQILNLAGPKDRLRFSIQFAGAGRTARWAGRGVQTQNLARTPKSLEDYHTLKACTAIIKTGDYDNLTLFMQEPMEGLVGTMRSSFRAPDGYEFTVADLASIETAVIAWLTNCQRLLQVFRDGKDPYKDFGTEFYRKPYDEITKSERTICKPPMLGCGYRLGGGELYDGKRTGLWGYAENMGVDMSRDQAHKSVTVYRSTYVEIPDYWKELERGVALTMRTGKPSNVGHLRFERRKPYLVMILPTGRCIYYFQPRMQVETISTGRYIEKIARNAEDHFLYGAHVGESYFVEETYQRLGFSHMGKAQVSNKWVRIPSHGGRIIEQATQGFAREVFSVGMRRAHRDGFRIVSHSHDELITLNRIGDNYHTLDRLIDHMREPLECAYGLPLNAAGFTSTIYRKD